MLLHKGATGIQRHGGGARIGAAVVLFLWVLLILAELGFFFAVHEETSKFRVKSSSNSTVPRKMRFLATQYSKLFHPPPSKAVEFSSSSSLLSSSSMVNNKNNTEGDSADKIYEDDKRIIHTGPNPLHN